MTPPSFPDCSAVAKRDWSGAKDACRLWAVAIPLELDKDLAECDVFALDRIRTKGSALNPITFAVDLSARSTLDTELDFADDLTIDFALESRTDRGETEEVLKIVFAPADRIEERGLLLTP